MTGDDLEVRCSVCGESVTLGSAGELEVLADPGAFLRRHQRCIVSQQAAPDEERRGAVVRTRAEWQR